MCSLEELFQYVGGGGPWRLCLVARVGGCPHGNFLYGNTIWR